MKRIFADAGVLLGAAATCAVFFFLSISNFVGLLDLFWWLQD